MKCGKCQRKETLKIVATGGNVHVIRCSVCYSFTPLCPKCHGCIRAVPQLSYKEMRCVSCGFTTDFTSAPNESQLQLALATS